MGGHPLAIQPYVSKTSTIAAVDHALAERTTLLQKLKGNLQQAQNIMRNQADIHRKDVQFRVKDWVLFKLRPYRH